MTISFENIYLLMIGIITIFVVIIIWLYRKRVSKPKLLILLLLYFLVVVMLKPTVNYPILANPRIPKIRKIQYIAESNIESLGYNKLDFNITIKKDNSNWLVTFQPKAETSSKKTINIWINDEFKVAKSAKK